MVLGINKAPIVIDLESVIFPVHVTPNPSPLGRGKCVAVMFQNPLLLVDNETTNNATLWIGNGVNQLWLLLPGQESPIFYAEDLKDIYTKLVMPFPNPNGVILTAGILFNGGGTGYTTDDVLTVQSPGGTNATVRISTIGEATAAVLGAGGAGYIVNDVLQLTGTGGLGSQTEITVDTVDGGGAILTFHISAPGTTATTGVKATTGGSGAGATIDITTVVGAAQDVEAVITGGTLFEEGQTYSTTGGTGEDAQVVVGNVEDSVPSSCELTCLMYRLREGGYQ